MPSKEYEIKFKNHEDSDGPIKVKISKSTKPNPGTSFKLPQNSQPDERKYEPVNDGELIFRITPDKGKGIISVYRIKTPHKYAVSNNGKICELKFMGLNDSSPIINNDPPTNVEVGVNDIRSPKQKK
jgi:hypothetical protein